MSEKCRFNFRLLLRHNRQERVLISPEFVNRLEVDTNNPTANYARESAEFKGSLNFLCSSTGEQTAKGTARSLKRAILEICHDKALRACRPAVLRLDSVVNDITREAAVRVGKHLGEVNLGAKTANPAKISRSDPPSYRVLGIFISAETTRPLPVPLAHWKNVYRSVGHIKFDPFSSRHIDG